MKPSTIRGAARTRMALAACLAGLFLSCAGPDGALLDMDYRAWPQTTDLELNYPIPGHRENYRRIFINPTGNQVVIARDGASKLYRYPAGTVIIKEIYEGSADPAPGQAPKALTGMVKAPEDPRSRGGWLWVMRDTATGNEQVFDGEFCFTCHANANEGHPYGDRNPRAEFRDYLFFPWDPEALPKPGAEPPAAP